MASAAPAPIPGSASEAAVNANLLLDVFLAGRKAERNDADRRLKDALERRYPFDLAAFRLRLVDCLSTDFRPGHPDWQADPDAVATREWLVYALGRVCGDDPAAISQIKRYLDPAQETETWVRYWALTGVARSQASLPVAPPGPAAAPALPVSPLLSALAALAVNDPAVEVATVGVAIQAAAGDASALGTIRTGLQTPGPGRESTLRALRAVLVHDRQVIDLLIDIVGKEANSVASYHAIRALRRLPPVSRFARPVSRALEAFVEQSRTYATRDAARVQALIGLGKLQVDVAVPVLVEELLDDNPSIVREAARSLESILGPRMAVARIVETAARPGGSGSAAAFARGLGWMRDREAVAAELAASMSSQQTGQQEVARLLLSEVGGSAAFQRLRAQDHLMAQHAEFIRQSESETQKLFDQSMADARSGFSLAKWMDFSAFCLGFGLLAASAAIALSNGSGSLASWAGVGTSAAGGVAGVLYALFVAKPRERVEEAVEHLMQIKVVFLGYLRQLHQVDQAYVRCLLEDKPITPEALQKFSDLIHADIQAATTQLLTRGKQAGLEGRTDQAGGTAETE